MTATRQREALCLPSAIESLTNRPGTYSNVSVRFNGPVKRPIPSTPDAAYDRALGEVRDAWVSLRNSSST